MSLFSSRLGALLVPAILVGGVALAAVPTVNQTTPTAFVPKVSCDAQNAAGLTFVGSGNSTVIAERRALNRCERSQATVDPATCHILSCTP